jgi:hypothetical protein
MNTKLEIEQLLEKIGFDYKLFCTIHDRERIICSGISLEDIQRYLRMEHQVYISVQWINSQPSPFEWTLKHIGNEDFISRSGFCSTYDKALSYAIINALKIIAHLQQIEREEGQDDESVFDQEITENDFVREFCNKCGTQRCGGINDEDFREGCQHWQKYYGINKDITSV